eukprot:753359-Hanusia_phi.AAC.1
MELLEEIAILEEEEHFQLLSAVENPVCWPVCLQSGTVASDVYHKSRWIALGMVKKRGKKNEEEKGGKSKNGSKGSGKRREEQEQGGGKKRKRVKPPRTLAEGQRKKFR